MSERKLTTQELSDAIFALRQLAVNNQALLDAAPATGVTPFLTQQVERMNALADLLDRAVAVTLQLEDL